MAKTRSEIKAEVVLNTGRSDKTNLMDTLCENALKLAVNTHPFEDVTYACDDLSITEDATSVDISALEEASVPLGVVVDILTVTVVEADGDRNYPLVIKNRQWWDKNIVNPEDNQKGAPQYGLKETGLITLDRPAESGWELRIRASAIPTFSSDSSECPIAIIDTFVVQYVTAFIYLSLGMQDQYITWYYLALGSQHIRGIVGGSLLIAMSSDRSEPAEDKKVDGGRTLANRGLAVYDVLNDRTVTWY